MELRKQIEDFKAFDEQEEKDKESILKWMDTFEDVLTRNNEFAHLTSSSLLLIKIELKF